MKKSTATTNWVHDITNKAISFPDKIKALLKIEHKLVKCQADEIKRLQMRPRDHKGAAYTYVEYLYDHYVVKKLPKTYLLNN